MTHPSQRDQGLRRLSRITRWVVTCGVAGTAAFSLLAARATTSKAASPARSVAPPESPSTSTPAPDPVAGVDPAPTVPPSTLAPPPTVPRPTRRQPVVVSGAS